MQIRFPWKHPSMYCPTHPGRKIAVLWRYGRAWRRGKTASLYGGRTFCRKGIDALCTVWEHSHRRSLKQCVQIAVRQKSIIMRTKQTWSKDLVKEVKSGDTVLVKAPHFMGFQEIVKGIDEVKIGNVRCDAKTPVPKHGGFQNRLFYVLIWSDRYLNHRFIFL